MENNENKNSKGLLILIVVFSLIVLGLGGWIVYDKVINKEEPKQEEKDNNENSDLKDESNDENIELNKIYEQFKKGNDSNAIVSHTKTKVICYSMNDDGSEYEDECEVPMTEYKYGNYLIKYVTYDGPADANSITILNQNNSKLYYNENVKTAIYSGDDYISLEPYIASGKLYFIMYDENDCYLEEDEKKPFIKYAFIDLNNNNIKINYLNTFKELIFEGREPLCK